MPATYRDIILKLGEADILNDEQAQKAADYSALRNVPAHQYLDIRWERIRAFIDHANEDFDSFTQAVSQSLEDNLSLLPCGKGNLLFCGPLTP